MCCKLMCYFYDSCGGYYQLQDTITEIDKVSKTLKEKLVKEQHRNVKDILGTLHLRLN